MYMNVILLHGVRNKGTQSHNIRKNTRVYRNTGSSNAMLQDCLSFLQELKLDRTKDAELHKRYTDWRQEVQLILETILSNVKDAKTMVKYVTLWAGKEAWTYLSTVEEHPKNSLESLFETLDDWTKPKADEIAAFTQLPALNQGSKTLSEFILEIRRLAELCNLTCNWDKEKLIRNCIVSGITSTKAYQQCLSKGSSLTLSECIKICQMEDATHRQVQTLRPEIQSQPELQDCPTPVHRVNNFHQPRGRSNFRGRGRHFYQVSITEKLNIVNFAGFSDYVGTPNYTVQDKVFIWCTCTFRNISGKYIVVNKVILPQIRVMWTWSDSKY